MSRIYIYNNSANHRCRVS